ncbi:MAG: DUF4199 domain-containing protein [Bacteroidales bacterium]|nr:DUF4199 domain-containing protein [Bacteroidales bacterium]
MSDKSKNSVWGAGLIYGSILGAISVIMSVIFYVLGYMMSDSQTYIGMGLSIVIIVYMLYMYRQEYMGGYVNYGRLVGLGAIIAAVSGIIGAIYLVVLLKYIDPSVQNMIDEKSMQKMMEQLAKRGMNPSADEIDSMMEKTKMFRSAPFLAIAGILNSAIFGTIISLIAAIFLKKENKDPFAGVEDQA